MIQVVIKRDGRSVDFDREKILNAIHSAVISRYSTEADRIIHQRNDMQNSTFLAEMVMKKLEVYSETGNKTEIGVEEIQDMVEDTLMETGYHDVAKSYIRYRENRSHVRDMSSKAMQIMRSLTFSDSSESDTKRENGNINGDTAMGLMLRYGTEVAKEFSLDNLVSPRFAEAHRNCDIHIHDLDFYSTGTLTCIQIPLGKLFKNGFSTGHGVLRPPKSIRAFSALSCIVIQADQNDCHGGQAIPDWDFVMAEGVNISFQRDLISNLHRVLTMLGLNIELQAVKDAVKRVIDDGYPLNRYATKEHIDKDASYAIGMQYVLIDLLNNDFGPLADNIDGTVQNILHCSVDDVEEETHQAMEAAIHNLNTLHCLPGSEHIWIHYPGSKITKLMSMQDINDTFEPGKYETISVNMATGEISYKPIIASQRKDNHRDLVTLSDATGQYRVTVTTNHKILSKKDDDTIFKDIPENLDNILVLNRSTANGVNICNRSYRNSGDEYVYDISVQDNENFLTEYFVFVSNSRAGAQVPFSSINFGMDTSDAGRLVNYMTLRSIEEGMGNGETPIFPVSIFVVKDGVNFKEGDPSYDLYKYAMKVTAKRLYPNFEFLDAPFNLQYYVPGKPETYVATMGCIKGSEVVRYQMKWRGHTLSRFVPIESLYNDMLYFLKETKVSENSYFIDTTGIIVIYDSYTGGYVECKKLIRNTMRGDEGELHHWVTLKFPYDVGGKYSITVTEDHPLPVEGKGRTFAKDIQVGDKIYLTKHPVGSTDPTQLVPIEIVAISTSEAEENEFSYDVETESDRFDFSGINSHNCRTRVMGNVNGPSITHGRGNLSFTSINLPKIALKHRNDVDGFFVELKEKMQLVEDQLFERYQFQCKKRIKNFPFIAGEGLYMDSEHYGPEDEMGNFIKHGTLSIGFIGLAETLVALIGKHHGESDEAQELGLKIIGYMREYCDDATKRRHLNYTLLATPAEGLAGRVTRMNKKFFGEVPGVTDREYTTNSFHIPVYYDIDAFSKIEREAPYHAFCNAGHISYIELDGDVTNNLEAIEEILAWMKEKGIGYGSLNHPVDYDPVCGYVGIIGDQCPRCGRKEFEAVPLVKLRKLGVWKEYNAKSIGYPGDPNEEADRMANSIIDINAGRSNI